MNAKTVVLNGERMNYDNRLDYSILSDEVKVYEQTEPSQILERIQGFDIVVTCLLYTSRNSPRLKSLIL